MRLQSCPENSRSNSEYTADSTDSLGSACVKDIVVLIARSRLSLPVYNLYNIQTHTELMSAGHHC
jgi:hypothetical protein